MPGKTRLPLTARGAGKRGVARQVLREYSAGHPGNQKWEFPLKRL